MKGYISKCYEKLYCNYYFFLNCFCISFYYYYLHFKKENKYISHNEISYKIVFYRCVKNLLKFISINLDLLIFCLNTFVYHAFDHNDELWSNILLISINLMVVTFTLTSIIINSFMSYFKNSLIPQCRCACSCIYLTLIFILAIPLSKCSRMYNGWSFSKSSSKCL